MAKVPGGPRKNYPEAVIAMGLIKLLPDQVIFIELYAPGGVYFTAMRAFVGQPYGAANE
jgi:hypothetical protein